MTHDDEFDFCCDGSGASASALSEPDLGEPIDAEFEVTPDPEPTATASAPAKAPRSTRSTSTARKGSYLYFDLETVPDFDRLDLFGLGPLPEPIPATPLTDCPPVGLTLSGTLADVKAALSKINPPPEWLNALEAEERVATKPRAGVFDLIKAARGAGDAYLDAIAERNKLLATTPEFCKIVALGFAIGGNEPAAVVLGNPDDTPKTGQVLFRSEVEILRAFWSLISDGATLVGFNCLAFDLPVIFVRSALLGVEPSKLIDTKPWGKDVIDLYHLRFGGRGPGAGRPGRLKDLARIYGLDVPAGDVDGSQVLDLWKRDPLKVGEYVRSDIAVTRGLHACWQGTFCL